MIPELVVLSGKGGTGKTSITAGLATLVRNWLFCDADVDAADLHLLLDPRIKKENPFIGGSLAFVRADNCTECGVCQNLCKFEAIRDDFVIDSVRCEGCGVCVDLCPESAIDFTPQQCGEWYLSETRFGPFVHARLGIAQENSGKLVSLVRKEAAVCAEEQNKLGVLTDGPPGIGCPVIASLGGASGVLIIAEPTVSGIHDMKRVVDLAVHFKVPGLVCVNKYDLNYKLTEEIISFSCKRNMEIVGKIPFDPLFVTSMVHGKTIIEYAPESFGARSLLKMWKKITQIQFLNNNLGLQDLSTVIT